jgi:hypothetical protein
MPQEPAVPPPDARTDAPTNTAPRQEPAQAPPEAPELPTKVIAGLRARLEIAVADHDGWADPIAFNGGTILVLALTALATVLPSAIPHGTLKWAAPVCSAPQPLHISRRAELTNRRQPSRDLANGLDRRREKRHARVED